MVVYDQWIFLFVFVAIGTAWRHSVRHQRSRRNGVQWEEIACRSSPRNSSHRFHPFRQQLSFQSLRGFVLLII